MDGGKATSAGVYNALTGGKDNYAADRETARIVTELAPGAKQAVHDNQDFLRRAIAWAAGQGVSQFLDLGCGYSPLTREAAREVLAGALVAYVDTDPVVVSHAAALESWPGVTAYRADLRDAGRILAGCEMDGWDLTRPVTVILGLVLHFLHPSDARAAVTRYVTRMAPGSILVASVGTALPGDLAEKVKAAYPVELHQYAPPDVEALFGGLELVKPGVAGARVWRPGWEHDAGRSPGHVLCGAGIKR